MTPDNLETEQRAAARAVYESTPECTFVHVAQQLSLPVETVRQWADEAKMSGSPWRMLHKWEAERRVGGKAELVADIRETQAEAQAQAQAVVDAQEAGVVEVQPGVNAELLKRHRQEWVGPRALVYQAIKLGQKGNVEGALAMAKLGKMSAEALTLVQAGERQAHGVRPGEDGATVVIERGGR